MAENNCKLCLHKDVCQFRDPAEDEIICSSFKNKADCAEVKHGEWIEVGENSTGKIMACTNCKLHINPNKKDVAMNRTSERPNYCSNCGAKMDGKKGEKQ